MKHLAIGFGIAFAIGFSLFAGAAVLLIAIGQKDLLSTAVFLIPSPFMLGPVIAQTLERDEGRKSVAAGRRKPVYDFGSFRIAWPLMVVYGTAAVAGIQPLCLQLVEFLIAEIGYELETKDFLLLGAVAAIFNFFVMYLVGRWIGTRCSRYGVATVLLVAVCSSSLWSAAEVLTLSDESYKQIHGGWEPISPGPILIIAVQAAMLFVVGLAGYWRGYKYRLSKYLNYLVSVLPPDTRETVVELAYEEAQKVAAAAVARASLERAGAIAKV